MHGKCKYPALLTHKQINAKLAQDVLAMKEKMAVTNVGMASQVSSFLKEWLMQHIQGEDNKYSSYMQQGGLK